MTQRRPEQDPRPEGPDAPASSAPAAGAAVTRPEPRTAILPPGAAAVTDPLIGQELCGYTIRRKLAEGGMGVVYEGLHATIGRIGAIKVLKPEFCRSDDVIERFRQEARAVNSIRHENIVDIYDFGKDPQGRVFFVMEYLEGEPLSARIRRGALPWSEAFPILEQTLRALKAAHDHHFVHRDLKPDNIWCKQVDGQVRVKLLDFGIAKLVGAETPADKLTKTGSMIGTPEYMSPEQINGSPDIDQRTDIYALGVIMYEMFAGVTPFAGDTLQAIMAGHLFGAPPRLADIPARLGVPPAIPDVVDRMLVKDRAGRYGSATDVLAALQAASTGQRQPGAGPGAPAGPLGTLLLDAGPSPHATAAPVARRPRALGRALLAGGAAAALALAGVAISRSGRHAPPPAAPASTGSAAHPAAPAALDYGALRARAQATLRAALRESNPAVRVQGADALGKIKDQPSVPALADLTEHDPDPEVRGHSAAALGAIGAAAQAPLLAKLEAAAPPPLKVWYASALARLGDQQAVQRLLAYARSKDLAVSFTAGLMLADVSPAGDRRAAPALKAIVAHEAELSQRDPYAAVTLAMKLAALGDAGARKYLYALLEHRSEGVRIAAAEALARLGHEQGRKVLADVVANPASPNRLIAALAQIRLGDHGGLDVITRTLDDPAPENRRLAAQGLGDIADRESLPRLIPLLASPDWTVRVAAARAIMAIVGLDPEVLARASVDWTKSALDSQDLAVRRTAAGVLSDIPAADALPLLAQAISDKDPTVRRVASRSAGKMKSAAAAARIADAVKQETDPTVKEQQVKALGEIGAIGAAAAHDTLARIADEPGRIGVLAAGSLIAVGDAGGKARLEAAVAAPQPELRLAAVEAATLANNPIVVPTLKLGLADRLPRVRLVSALGLATFDAEKAEAVPVLTDALDSQDADVVGQAIAALIRFGQKVEDLVRSAGELLDSPDPVRRLAVVPIAQALSSSQSLPLVRRLVADPDRDVRRAAIETVAHIDDREQAINLYKPLVTDPDPVVRARAAGQLARLVPPAPGAAPRAAAVAPRTEPGPVPAPHAPDVSLPKVQQALADTRGAADGAKREADGLEAVLADLSQSTAGAAHGEAVIEHVKAAKSSLERAAPKLEAAAAGVDSAATATSEAAGPNPSPDAARLVAEAKALAARARGVAAALHKRSIAAARSADEFVSEWTGDAQLDIDTANAKSDVGNFAEAKRLLDRAARQLRKSGARSPALDYAYAQLFEKMADDAQARTAKRDLLQRALDAYRRVSKSGGGRFREQADARLAKLPEEIDALGAP